MDEQSIATYRPGGPLSSLQEDQHAKQDSYLKWVTQDYLYQTGTLGIGKKYKVNKQNLCLDNCKL